MSRDDEAIAAAEVLVLQDEFDSLRRREAEAAQALSERAEVRCASPVHSSSSSSSSGFLRLHLSFAWCVAADASFRSVMPG
jgi:hypothetical protein